VDELSEDALSEDARKLIDTAMGKDDAPAPDASWGAFVVRMTSTQPRSREVIIEPAPKPRKRWWPALVGVVAIMGIAAWLIARDRSQSGEPASTVTKAPAKARTADDVTPPRPRAEPAKAPAAAIDVATLIPDAEAALAADDPAKALALLDTHAERAPLADAERRMSLRVLVLCALDRTDAAKAEARAFLDTHPSSRWADDVRRSCAGQ
jgi:hypothetical protein